MGVVYQELGTDFASGFCWDVDYVLDGVVVGECLEQGIEHLPIDPIVSRMHIVHRLTYFYLSIELFYMILEMDLESIIASILVTVGAFYPVIHDISGKPFSIVKGYIQVYNLFVTFFSLYVTQFADYGGVEFIGCVDVSLVGIQN